MPKYLFTNDQRISDLNGRIKWVADYVQSGKDISAIPNKSDNNNAATLAFYYNLYPSSEICKTASKEPVLAIRNFILKFQYPNTRTEESFSDSLSEKALFAPYRTVITVLYKMSLVSGSISYLSFDEILYFIFCNKEVYANPRIDYALLISKIRDYRKTNLSLISSISAQLQWKQYNRQIGEMMAVLRYGYHCFSVKNSRVVFDPTGLSFQSEKNLIEEIINYNRFWVPSDSSNFILSSQEYTNYMDTSNIPYQVVDLDSKSELGVYNDESSILFKSDSLQKIFYGAPGTGKSHKIKELVDKKGLPCIRTTFHPDSDYSTFVGAYKPTTVDVPVMTIIGKEQVPVVNAKPEKKIVYKFVPQAFLKAYTAAWKNQDKPFYLIIEEINRGNCAQIFGDLFQLLDRNDEGYSDYEISPDEDIQLFLQTDEKFGFAALTDEQKEAITENILTGEIMKLPNNLHIWATMNTSDQSLFPIDSAFKRRWDWEYLPIYDAEKGWTIEVNNKLYGWWNFLELMNDKIGSTTNSEDKKLGYFFCKPQNGIIDAKTFVGKVIFYIWNDVFKDFAEEAGDLFKDVDGKLLSFDKFYVVDTDGQTVVNENKVELFLQHLGVLPVTELEPETEPEDEDGNSATSSSKDFSKFSVNGEGRYGKNRLAAECMRKYLEINPNMPVETVLKNWKSLGNIVPHFVESKEEFDSRTDSSKRSIEFPCGGTFVYVANDGYGDNGKVELLIDKVNTQNWGITLAKIEE